MSVGVRSGSVRRWRVAAGLAAAGVVLAVVVPVGAQPPQPPQRPTGLSVVSVSHDSVSLGWDDPGDASITGYEILRRDRDADAAGVFVSVVADTGSPTVSFVDSSVEAERRYVYRVVALNEVGSSPRSGFVRVDTPAEPPQAQPPGRPTGLSAVSAAHDSVSLGWDDPEDASVTGYEILRRDRDADAAGVFVSVVADTGSAAAAYVDASVAAERRYVYRVVALNEAGSSPRSGYVNVDTPAAPEPEPEPAPVPEPVAVSEGSGVLWSAVVTVGVSQAGGQAVLGYSSFAAVGASSPTVGAMTSTRFESDGEPVEVMFLGHMAHGDELVLGVVGDLDPSWVLVVDDVEFAVADASMSVAAADIYRWAASGIDWAEGGYAAVHLAAPVPAVLDDLEVDGTNGVDFDPDENRFETQADPGTTQITVTAPPKDPDTDTTVTVVRTDGELGFDNDDTDPDSDGHQTPLSEGGDTIVVTRTDNGTTQRVYVVTVNPPPDNNNGGNGGSGGSDGNNGGQPVRTVPVSALTMKTATAVHTTMRSTAVSRFQPAVGLTTSSSVLRTQVVNNDNDDTPDAALGTLTVTGATLNEDVNPDTFDYTATADADTDQVTITATARTASAEVAFDLADADPHTEGHQIDLLEPQPGGEPTHTAIAIAIRHTANDITAVATYTLTIKRTPPEPQTSQQRQHGFTKIDAGWGHACALRVNGQIVCWGSNEGRPKSNSFYPYFYPARSPALPGPYTDVDAGRFGSCGVLADGRPDCFDLHIEGGLCVAVVGPCHIMATRLPTADVVSVSHYTSADICWLNTNGTVGCRAGVPGSVAAERFQSVDSGFRSGCGLTDSGRARCWYETSLRSVPDDEFKYLTYGGSIACGIKADDTLLCWGYIYNRAGPMNVLSSPEGTFTQVESSYHYSCGVKTDGTALCWGNSKLSAGSVGPIIEDVPEGSFEQVSVDFWDFACGLKTDGSVVCWGDPENNFNFGIYDFPPTVDDETRLLSLEVSDAAFDFEFGEESYSVAVANDVAAVTVTAEAFAPGASSTIGPDDSDIIADGHQVALTAGVATDITVTVTAADGTSTRTYTVTVTRASS